MYTTKKPFVDGGETKSDDNFSSHNLNETLLKRKERNRARHHSAEQKGKVGVKLLLYRTKIRKRKIDAKFPVGYWVIGLLVYWFVGLLVEKKIQGQKEKN